MATKKTEEIKEEAEKTEKKTTRKRVGAPKSNSTSFDSETGKAAGKKNAGRKKSTSEKVAKSIASNPSIVSFSKENGKAITPEVRSYISEALTKPDENGRTFVYDFIDNFLATAKSDPNSQAGRIIAGVFFEENLLQQLDKRVLEEQNKNIDFQLYRLRQTLYDKQQEVFDNNNDRTIMNFSGRRSGKSELNQRIILKHALKHRNSICLYLNRNFDNSITQGYDTMVKLLDSMNIPYDSSKGNGLITLDNGTQIFYRGASNTVDIDKFRGVAKMACAIIDEAGHIKGLRYLLTEILQPATIDIADSQIIMTGTPPRTKNFAYNLWNNQDATIKRYNWNFMSNPFLPNRESVIPEVAKMYGVPEDAAFIRREYLGDMNALDDDARIFINYQYNPYNTKQLEPMVFDRLIFAIDWGYEDEAAIVCFAADKQNKRLIQVDEWHAPHRPTSEIIEQLRTMYDIYTNLFHCAKLPYIICDTNEKDNVLELSVTHKFKNVMCAYKFNKNVGLKQLSSMMNTGNVLINKNSYLDDEAQNMLWKRDEESDKIIEEVDDDAYHANGMMALLYASRQFAVEYMGYADCNKSAKAIATS